MRVVWPSDNSPKDPPEYSPEEEAASLKAAEERLMRKKAAGLLRKSAEPRRETTVPKTSKVPSRVRVLRDANGAITGFERQD